MSRSWSCASCFGDQHNCSDLEDELLCKEIADRYNQKHPQKTLNPHQTEMVLAKGADLRLDVED